MQSERQNEAFEGDAKLTVIGRRLQPGDRAPHFELDILEPGAAFPRAVKLSDSNGRVRILNVINSIDTPVCHIETQKWQKLRAELPKNTDVFTVSMDLPFALLRWSADENVDHPMLSSHRSDKFGIDYGVLLKEWRLLQRAVFVIDENNIIRHAEYVADQMLEPDYDKALASI
jgi:thioredoxin-dependent peroxiredoxin